MGRIPEALISERDSNKAQFPCPRAGGGPIFRAPCRYQTWVPAFAGTGDILIATRAESQWPLHDVRRKQETQWPNPKPYTPAPNQLPSSQRRLGPSPSRILNKGLDRIPASAGMTDLSRKQCSNPKPNTPTPNQLPSFPRRREPSVVAVDAAGSPLSRGRRT